MSDVASDGAAENPFVGPRAFRTGERLHGRETELAALVDLLIAERVVLMYSPSGAGKSSLIEAELRPELSRPERRFRVLPTMRVSHPPPDDLPVANRFVLSLLLSLEAAAPAARQLPLRELARMSLAGYLDQQPIDLDAPESELLIFDQFEEILTIDPTGEAAKEQFFAQVGAALRDRQRWALFSMREEFVAALDRYVPALPTRLRNRFRLELLRADAARRAIQRPPAALGVTVTDAAAAALVQNLALVRVPRPDGTVALAPGPYVEPVHLQVVCRGLWERLGGRAVIDEADVRGVGDVDSALRRYYEEQVAGAARDTGVSERAIRRWFGRYLIVGGIRGQVQKGGDPRQQLDDAAARRLVNAYLVREEQRRNSVWYELAHDRLIDPVQQSNRDWFEQHATPLEQAARLWESRGRPEELLVAGSVLREFEEWAAAHDDELTAEARAYIAASRALDERRQQEALAQERAQAVREREVGAQQRRYKRLLAGAAVLLAAALLGVAAKWREADRNFAAAAANADSARAQRDAATALRRQAVTALGFLTRIDPNAPDSALREALDTLIRNRQDTTGAREAVTIEYFKKDIDGQRLGTLAALGFDLRERPAIASRGTNAIYYGRVTRQTLEFIADRVLGAGVEIRAICPFRNPVRLDSALVQILYTVWAEPAAPVTMAQVRSAPSPLRVGGCPQ